MTATLANTTPLYTSSYRRRNFVSRLKKTTYLMHLQLLWERRSHCRSCFARLGKNLLDSTMTYRATEQHTWVNCYGDWQSWIKLSIAFVSFEATSLKAISKRQWSRANYRLDVVVVATMQSRAWITLLTVGMTLKASIMYKQLMKLYFSDITIYTAKYTIFFQRGARQFWQKLELL